MIAAPSPILVARQVGEKSPYLLRLEAVNALIAESHLELAEALDA